MKLDDKKHVSELSIRYCGIISKNNAMYFQKDVADSIKIIRY